MTCRQAWQMRKRSDDGAGRRPHRVGRRALNVLGLALGVLVVVFVSIAGVTAVREGPQRLDPRGLSGCQMPLIVGIRDPETCTLRVMRQLVEREGIDGLERIADYYDHGGSWYRDRCHVLMHPVGRAFASDIQVDDLLALPPNDCLGGFLHGVIEVRARNFQDEDAASMRELCGASVPSQEMDCLHGIGHALMRALDNDLPTAISRCTVPDDPELTINCAGGVMMENMFAVQGVDDAAPTRWFDPADPGRTCRGTEEIVAEVCHAWDVALLKPERRLAYCGSLEDVSNVTCMRSVGASEERLGLRLCGGEEECWFGFGYSQQLTSLARKDEADPCEDVPGKGLRGCLRGAAFAMWAATPSANPLDESWCEEQSADTGLVDACARELRDPVAAVGFL
jgi:hypothetical protein